jgi:hypothetical protein
MAQIGTFTRDETAAYNGTIKTHWTCFGKVERHFQIMRPVSRTVRGLEIDRKRIE